MIEYIAATSEPIILLCLGAFFIIIFSVILKVLMDTFFEGRTAIVVAFCVSLLGILGLHQTFFAAGEMYETPGEVPAEAPTRISESDGKTGLRVLLLPYTALAIVILLMVLLLAAKRLRLKNMERCSKPIEQQYTGAKLTENSDEDRRMSK